jgi:hypothetical protein
MPVGHDVVVRLFRRIIAALIMTGAAAGAIRVRGWGGTPPQHGGWEPIRVGDDSRPEPR